MAQEMGLASPPFLPFYLQAKASAMERDMMVHKAQVDELQAEGMVSSVVAVPCWCCAFFVGLQFTLLCGDSCHSVVPSKAAGGCPDRASGLCCHHSLGRIPEDALWLHRGDLSRGADGVHMQQFHVWQG